jgi:hypothetical protein
MRKSIITTQQFLAIESAEPVKRLQDEELVSATPKVDIAWDVIPSDAEIPDATLELSDTLQRLHATTLTAFEAAPNFGSQRMPPIIRESSPPRHAPLLNGEFDDYADEQSARPSQPSPSEAWRWLKLMSGLCKDGFVYRPYDVHSSLPLKEAWDPPRRDLVVSGFPDPDAYRDFADGLSQLTGQPELWKVVSLELIGLANRETPMVFEHQPESPLVDEDGGRVSHSENRKKASPLATLNDSVEINVMVDSNELTSTDTTPWGKQFIPTLCNPEN